MVPQVRARATDPGGMALELTLPVNKVPATLVLGDGTRHDVSVFIAAGQEIEELLTAEQWFLPTLRDGQFRMYARRAVACLSLPVFRAPRDGEEDAILPMQKRSAVVHLCSGSILNGELRYLAPPERRRTADFLNEEAALFTLYDSETVHYVVKAHVAYVEEAP